MIEGKFDDVEQTISHDSIFAALIENKRKAIKFNNWKIKRLKHVVKAYTKCKEDDVHQPFHVELAVISIDSVPNNPSLNELLKSCSYNNDYKNLDKALQSLDVIEFKTLDDLFSKESFFKSKYQQSNQTQIHLENEIVTNKSAAKSKNNQMTVICSNEANPYLVLDTHRVNIYKNNSSSGFRRQSLQILNKKPISVLPRSHSLICTSKEYSSKLNQSKSFERKRTFSNFFFAFSGVINDCPIR